MKFEELYKQFFIAEEVKVDDKPSSDVAMPEDFDDVEPAPLPELETTKPSKDSTEEISSELSDSSVGSVQSSSNLQGYIQQLEDFATTLNDPTGESLQTMVSKLDQPGTAFEGISSRTKADILRAAEVLRTVSEQLKSFLISAAKAK
jgi:hypothetical protein